MPIVLGRASAETYGAALTFLSRIAVSAGARRSRSQMGRPDALGTEPAIFVGALGQFSAPTVAEFGVADAARTAWDEPQHNPDAVVALDVDPGSIVPNSFGESSSTRGRLRPLAERAGQSERHPRALARIRALARAELRSLLRLARHLAGPDAPFDPSDRATLVVVQAPKAFGAAMDDGHRAERRGSRHRRRGDHGAPFLGRAATAGSPPMTAQPASRSFRAQSERYILTGGFSLENIRLIAANWLSVNIVAYAVALVLLCCILGICTSALLSRLGRRS